MLKPLGDRVLVEIIEETEQKTAGGLYVPDSAKEKSQRGKVVAVGSGKTLDNGTKVALEVKTGDTVYFAKYGGTEVSLEGKNYSILPNATSSRSSSKTEPGKFRARPDFHFRTVHPHDSLTVRTASRPLTCSQGAHHG